eukprot:COSAG05_NODE_20973_length_275_cov_0.875000_2_plen_29_part_01
MSTRIELALRALNHWAAESILADSTKHAR